MSVKQRQDIVTRKDIEMLVNHFYDRVRSNALLSPHFTHVDWPKHLPIIVNFWTSAMLGEQSYTGNPFQKHVSLPLEPRHFKEWLRLFFKTVDEYFAGEKAAEIKLRAQSIANVFQYKMGLLK